MKTHFKHLNLWIPTALLVLVTPPLMNMALDTINHDDHLIQSMSNEHVTRRVTSLPQSLPVRAVNDVLGVQHHALTDNVYRSVYRNQLGADNNELVPYIPRLYNLDDFTQTNLSERSLNDEPYSRTVIRKKFGNQHYVAYYQFRVGRVATSSYTKAKLYQLPAAFIGAQDFTLTIWQMQCSQPSCENESDTVERMLSQPVVEAVTTRPISQSTL